MCRRETEEREKNIESARGTMGRGKRGSEAPAFFRLVKLVTPSTYSKTSVFVRLATKLVHMTKMSILWTIFEKVRFRCRDERLTGKEKKICFLKYEDTYGQDQSQLSVAPVPILCFRNPHNTLRLPSLPLQKKSHKLLFSNVPRRTAYSLDQEQGCQPLRASSGPS